MTEIHPISSDVTKLIVKGLDGEFRVPESAAGLAFVQDTIRAAVAELEEQDIEGNELRSYAPGYGHGSTLDLTTPEDFADLIAELHAWSFEGEILEIPERKGTPPFQQEMTELMMSVHDDIYSEVGRAFDEGDLELEDGLVVIPKDPDPEF